MMGRAGRPKYDDVGEAWLLAKGRDEESHLVDLYLHGEPEEVTSKLANPNALRAEEDLLCSLTSYPWSLLEALVTGTPSGDSSRRRSSQPN